MDDRGVQDEPSATQMELDLVARWRQGEVGAFDTLYHMHAPRLARRLRRILGNNADTEDLLQQTFLTAFKILARFRPESSLGAWLFGISYRLVGNHLRAKKRRRRRETGREEWELPPGVDRHETEAAHTNRDLAKQLYGLLDQLPDDKRTAFTLHYLEGMGFTEIGKLVGASPQTIWARVDSARARLEELLPGLSNPGGRR